MRSSESRIVQAFVPKLMLVRYMEESRTLESEIDEVKNAHEQIFNKPPSDVQKTTMQVKSLEVKRLVAEDHIRENLEPYSRAISRHFCEKIVTRLPLELRYIIYEDLITPDYIYVGPQYLTNAGRPCENDRDAHFWSAEYVGEAISVELVQCWYRVSLFYSWDKAHNIEVIERFMACDRWDLDIKPHEHLSRVRFDLSDRDVHTPFHVKNTARCIPQDYATTLCAPLRSCTQFRFPNRVRFLIRIHTLGSLEFKCFHDGTLHETLEELLSDLRLLRAGGHRFNVQWSETSNLEFGSADCKLSAEVWQFEIEKVSSR
jgi:hypothetical protein